MFLTQMLALVLGSAPAYAQNCAALTQHGIYDIHSQSTNKERFEAFFTWFCKSNFQERSQYEQAAGELGIPVDGVPLNLGMSNASGSWSREYNEFCKTDKKTTLSKTSSAIYIAKINPLVVAAFERCISRNGFHVWVENGADERVFVLRMRYVASGTVSSATVEPVQFLPQTTCGVPLQRPFKVGAAGKSVLCKRTSDEPLTITVNANELPLVDTPLTFPAINRAPPSPCSSFSDILGIWVGEAPTPTVSGDPPEARIRLSIDDSCHITGSYLTAQWYNMGTSFSLQASGREARGEFTVSTTENGRPLRDRLDVWMQREKDTLTLSYEMKNRPEIRVPLGHKSTHVLRRPR